MKTTGTSRAALRPMRLALPTAVAAALLCACAATPMAPDGAAALRDRLTRLQSDPMLASRAPLAIRDADVAVSAAEKPQTDPALGIHLVFMAERKIDIAESLAQGRLSVDQRVGLAERRDEMRLQARTKEADLANDRAMMAQADANDQKSQADAANRRAARSDSDAESQKLSAYIAQSQVDAAQFETAQAQSDAADLRRQIDGMQAKVTERGLVLTLGDVLFDFDTSKLNSGGTGHLDKLAMFLARYPKRTAQIEGYTDSVGTKRYNQDLSQRRADAVKSFLVGQGIAADRLDASGKGMDSPVADNASEAGRQQNRRVEVIIDNRIASAQ